MTDYSGHWVKAPEQVALEAAEETAQHIWNDSNGQHISATGDHDTSGFHQLLTSTANFFRNGTTNLARFAADAIELGMNSTTAVIKMCAGTFQIFKTTLENGTAWSIIRSDSDIYLMAPNGKSSLLTTYTLNDEGNPVPSDNYAGMMGADVVLRGHNLLTNSKTIDMSTFESEIVPTVGTGSANFPADWTVGAFKLIRRGNEVCCRIDATYKTPTTLDYDLFTIPAAFRPTAEVTAPGVWATGTLYPAFLKIESSGSIHVISNGAGQRLSVVAFWTID